MMKEGFKKLSVRYQNHEQCFYKPNFLAELDTLRTGNEISTRRRSPDIEGSDDLYISNITEGGSGAYILGQLLKTTDDIDTYLNRFLDIIPSLKEYV